jgi:predicted MPP superfamily phosphohydrolase
VNPNEIRPARAGILAVLDNHDGSDAKKKPKTRHSTNANRKTAHSKSKTNPDSNKRANKPQRMTEKLRFIGMPTRKRRQKD